MSTETDLNKDKSSVAIAMVAASSMRLPPAREIVAAAGGRSAKSPSLLGRLFGAKPGAAAAAKEQQWEDSNLVFSFRDGMIAVALMPGPIPWSDLEGPCATAWWWPDATERMRAHTYHFIVTVMGGTIPPVERRVILTNIVRAVLRHTDAVGVYWAEGTVVHEPNTFLEQSEGISETQIPGPLWIDVRVEQNDDEETFRCFTTGLAPLGHLEIEVERASLKPHELLEFIGDTACYIVNTNTPIADNETLGRTATEKFKVRHAKSMFDRGTVMRINMNT
jgi:Domain of unknown function (DUF4261)